MVLTLSKKQKQITMDSKVIEQLCKEFLPNAVDLSTFRPKEVMRLEMAFIQGANVMMNYIKNNNSDGWIEAGDLKNGLPEKEDFLCLFDNGEIARYYEEDLPIAILTHWMPLPSPPIQQQ